MKKTKELTILILPIVLVLSTFFFNPILQKTKEFSFIYLNKMIFIPLVFVISSYIVYLFKAVERVLPQNKLKCLISSILGLLLICGVGNFIHTIGEGIFFFNMLLINLLFSIIISLLIGLAISYVIKHNS